MSSEQVILCPGQGAQSVGMGQAWFDASAEAARTFGAADEVLGDRFDGRRLSELCFTGPEETLNRTDIAQPAIFTASIACLQAMIGREEIASHPVATAGLSLGEYSALCVAGSITFTQGLEIVALRGRAMQEAAEAVDSSMVALIGAEEEQAHEVCERSAKGEVLVMANFNAPGQIVLSGHSAACDRAVEIAGEMGLRATKLAVAGAFHSPLMQPAADRLAAALERVEIRPPECPVVSNVTGVPHGTGPDEGKDVCDSIRERLVEQLLAPVRWAESCRWLADNVKGEYHELAPGKVLSGLMRRIERSIKVANHDKPAGD